MATNLSTTLQPSNSTDTLFRAWCTFIRDGFDLAGWVQVDSTDLTTVTHPTLTSNFPVKLVYRMDDALAGSSPVYVMIECGSDSGSANNPAIRITIGTGYSAGAITGSIFTTPTASLWTRSNTSSTSLNPSYSLTSGATARIAVALFAGTATGNPCFTFGIERAKDSDGNDVAGALYVCRSTGTSGLNTCSYVSMTTGISGLVEGRVSAVIPTNSQSLTTQSDVGVGFLVPWQSITQPAPHATNYVYVTPADWTTDLFFTVNMYGSSVRFRRLHTYGGLIGGPTSNVQKTCMRFD